jgi:hypothetical protein
MATAGGRYRIEFKPSAAAELAKIPNRARRQIAARIDG